MSWYPVIIWPAPQSRALIETLTDASLDAKAALEDVMDQFFVETATWGLDLWEQQVGIETDHSLSQADRRAAIKQSLVASGNTTAEMVRQLAEAITGYEAESSSIRITAFRWNFWERKMNWPTLTWRVCAL